MRCPRPRLPGRLRLSATRLRRPRFLPERLPRPRSLRSRLVLIAGLLATSAVLLCQLAGLAVLRGWLTDQVDNRLSQFRPPAGVYTDLAEHGTLRPPSVDNALPSDYRVFFYDGTGRLLPTTLGSGDGAGPKLPRRAAELHLTAGRPSTVPAKDGAGGAGWRVISYTGPDRMRTVVALPLSTVDGATTKLLWLSLGLGVAVAVGVIALGNGAVRLGLRPLTRVERTAQQITEGALELNVPVTDPDTEVGRLGLALNTMLDRLRTSLHRTASSEQQLRRFLADAGHELRTPLTAIQGFAELLLDEADMPPRRRWEAHALIAHNAERMSRLVDDLFLLAKLGDTPATYREPVDLLSAAADAIATTAIRHPQHAITLEPLTDRPADAERDLDIIETPGDPHQLAQVLGNLLSNACVHTPAGTRVSVRVGASRTRTAATCGSGPPLPPGTPVCVVEVTDDGPGISADEAPNVFDRFYRATPLGGSATPDFGAVPGAGPGTDPGSGLGLAIASAIAAAHGGRLELDNRPGEGCTFRLLLPDTATASPDTHGPWDRPSRL
ncbi:two-component system, OmpR family, sensor kinase [Actinacidiphila alni]|uniref:histidine kinase n=1 Tax=Actinacidiphila alni TaxID=380248 RepID=A0A1I1XFY7_9ACTN|nr:HAMP domain-containing sensor histidine kinase [Actinacidiphila alni]SFE06061.1 two-component system, OmpR family, sensor kinase [Actinacidiphila alni]